MAMAFAVAIGILTVLSGLTVANFVSVARDHALAQVGANQSFAILGDAGAGRLLDGGTARLRVNVSVSNPSSRSLVFDTVIYKAWIEDRPREIGSNASRSDVLVEDGGSMRWFHKVFSGSNTSSRVAVPAYGVGVVPLVLDLRMVPDPLLFQGVQNITDFAISEGTSPTAIPWLIFILTSLYIDGVPQPESPTAPLYLLSVVRIVLQFGVDYGE